MTLSAAEHAGAVAREAVRSGLAEREAVRSAFFAYRGRVRSDDAPTGTFTRHLLDAGVIDQAGFERLEAAVPLDGPLPAHLDPETATHSSQVFVNALRRGESGRLPRPGSGSDSGRLPRPGGDPESPPPPPPPPPAGGEEGAAVVGGERTMAFEGVLEAEAGSEERPPDGDLTDPYGRVLRSPRPGSDEEAVAEARPREEPTDPYNRVLRESSTQGVLEESAEAGGERTMEFDQVLGAPAAPPEEDEVPAGLYKTVEYEEVIRPDAGGPQPEAEDAPLGLLSREAGAPVAATADSRGPELGLPGIESSEASTIASVASDVADGLLGESIGEPEMPGPRQLATEPRAGERLGAYELERVIGRGGMGVIYLARVGPERFAIKVLVGPGDDPNDRRRRRFRREFEALRRLDHESIVAVHDYGRYGPFDWYSMDYVEGRSLEQVLKEGALSREERLTAFEDVCEAIAHAHERSVVHRDLKPANVIVDARSRGHVLDFGLAKILDQGFGMTRTGSTLGTPYYMAPEQVRSAKHIDERVDVFALGAILYELMTGERSFEGDTAAEVGNLILSTDPPRPTRREPSLHPDFDALCMRALEKDPDRRYPSAVDLLRDLRRHRGGQGVRGERGVRGAVRTTRRWARRNRAGIVGGLIASAVVAPASIALAVWAGSRPASAQPDASPSPGPSGSPSPDESPSPGESPAPDDGSSGGR